MKTLLIALIIGTCYSDPQIIGVVNYKTGYSVVNIKDTNDYTKRYTVTQVMVNTQYHMYCIGGIAYFNKKGQQYGYADGYSCFPNDMNAWQDVVKGTFSYDIEQYVIKHKSKSK